MPEKRNPCCELCLLILYLSNKLCLYSVSEEPMLPMSPPEPQVRTQEAGRVKDFPGGNVTMSASRIAFLRSLCQVPKYLHLVDLVDAVVGAFFD